MVENIVLDTFPKESGVYMFKTDEKIIYVGSSNNLYMRMAKHRSSIRKGSEHGYKQDLYQYLQANTFTVEFQLTDNYRQLEQELVEKYNPKYNSHRAYTGVACNGNKAEYDKKYKEKYKEEILEQQKQYYKSTKGKESQKKASNKYNNQLCFYNGETLTLTALSKRFKKQGFDHPTQEAKKYIIKKEPKTPIEFYDVYP